MAETFYRVLPRQRRGFILKFMNRTVLLLLSLILLLTAIVAIVAYLNLWPIKHPIVIHFDSFRGIDFSGDRGDVLGIFAVAAVLTLLNGGLAAYFWKRATVFSYILLYFNIFIWLLILIIIGVIISVN